MHASSDSFCVELSWHPPEYLFTLCHGQPHSVFLDSGGDPQQDRHRWSMLCPHPTDALTIRGDNPSLYWSQLRHFWQKNAPALPSHAKLPFMGGIIAVASYEAGLACEGIRSRHIPPISPITALACRNFFMIDRRDKRLWWISPDGTPPPKLPDSAAQSTNIPSLSCHPDFDEHAWNTAIRDVRHYIQQGDIFQANLTMRWHAPRSENLDVHALYTRLRHQCPAPFGAWFHTPSFSLLSASVERFLSLSSQGLIETRPIKGTIGVSTDAERNIALQKTLAHDEKERAENIMITDLMRHDIGRVSQLGSVHVPQLCTVERFAHVHHLVSSVQGQLKPGLDALDLLAATLPPGSVTGAPKHRALEIIDEIEISARGAYCGTLFRLGWDGSLDSSVIIRSISATSSTLSIGAGGGITWPSDAAREYQEMCLKAAPLLEVLNPS
ncbi:anthranilate synthase component I family protein [Saccharibacter sp. 17.LH.SD]|uniref:anthranilate synthase component I family protein n=1 Tax=Saccharibacter sp. 17.LH.SD TaxID=2689393 RepID=UPI00136F4C2C|nr:anthranilate synthase component I family protein [Saccharibacter sp. 17.LH.SD]MXV45057.1 anthranilate synthase component I family protein [Saccharibacter sp. 17.LH.SD]